jgi:hypothetical protein
MVAGSVMFDLPAVFLQNKERLFQKPAFRVNKGNVALLFVYHSDIIICYSVLPAKMPGNP